MPLKNIVFPFIGVLTIGHVKLAKKMRVRVRDSHLRVLLPSGVGHVACFSDEYPDQPESACKQGEDEVEDKVSDSVLFHGISSFVRGVLIIGRVNLANR
jgi:hypothetical protein